MNLITQLQWSIRQAYIKRLLEFGVNSQWIQMELEHITNDQMADLIKGMIKLGVKPNESKS